MFGYFTKRREKRRISDDLQETMVLAYDALREAVDIRDPHQKHHEMHMKLTQLSLALHDVYPTFPQEKESIFVDFVAASLERKPYCGEIQNIIEEHIRACPDIPAAKFDFMTYLLAPKFMEDFAQKRQRSK